MSSAERNIGCVPYSFSLFAFSSFRQGNLCFSNTVFHTERDYKYFLTTQDVVKCKQCVVQEAGSGI